MKFKKNDLEYHVTLDTDKNQFVVYQSEDEMMQASAPTIEQAVFELEQLERTNFPIH